MPQIKIFLQYKDVHVVLCFCFPATIIIRNRKNARFQDGTAVRLRYPLLSEGA